MTSSEQMRQWKGPALFSYGFRPFFLFGALWAAVAMILWIMMLADVVQLPIGFDPISWHAHEFLFGYLGAIIAGFLLTAVPNWTGRLPVVGWSLAGLFSLWFAGRIAVALSSILPQGMAQAIDLLFPIILGGVILREIIAGKNWRNLVVLILLGVFTLANLVFHLEAARGDVAAHGIGLRLGVATVLLLISLVGGRIVPSFTRNWLVKQGQNDLPTPPMQKFDKVTLLATVLALTLWVFLPFSAYSGVALIGMSAMHLARLVRWKGYHTLSEPLLWVLHLGYLCIPLGGLIEGFSLLRPDVLPSGSAQHLWMAGGFGLMTLAVMARATLGHTGQKLQAGTGSVLMFLSVIGSVLARLCAGLIPDSAMQLYSVSAVLWVGAFAGFCILFGASLLKTDAPHKGS